MYLKTYKTIYVCVCVCVYVCLIFKITCNRLMFTLMLNSILLQYRT